MITSIIHSDVLSTLECFSHNWPVLVLPRYIHDVSGLGLFEQALGALDLDIADKAFVRCSDYQGIEFVKHLTKLDDNSKQRAELATYSKVCLYVE
jgi:hypothetical protein